MNLFISTLADYVGADQVFMYDNKVVIYRKNGTQRLCISRHTNPVCIQNDPLTNLSVYEGEYGLYVYTSPSGTQLKKKDDLSEQQIYAYKELLKQSLDIRVGLLKEIDELKKENIKLLNRKARVLSICETRTLFLRMDITNTKLMLCESWEDNEKEVCVTVSTEPDYSNYLMNAPVECFFREDGKKLRSKGFQGQNPSDAKTYQKQFDNAMKELIIHG